MNQVKRRCNRPGGPGGQVPKGDIKAKRHTAVLWMKDASLSLCMIKEALNKMEAFLKNCSFFIRNLFTHLNLNIITEHKWRLCKIYTSFVFFPQVFLSKSELKYLPHYVFHSHWRLFTLQSVKCQRKKEIDIYVLTHSYMVEIYTNCFHI